MYISLLFRPSYRRNTGTILCPHAAEEAEDANPYLIFSTQWQRYLREVVVPGAHHARHKLPKRNEWESFWESKEVVVALLELSKKGPFEDEALSLEAARCAATAHALVHDRITVQEYACLVVHRSAQHYEGIALARVAPKVRRDALALDAEEDRGVRRCSTEHDGDDFEDAEDGRCGEEMVADIDQNSCPLKPVDALSAEEWKKGMAVYTEANIEFCQGDVRMGTSS